jgi:hypothetical protein
MNFKLLLLLASTVIMHTARGQRGSMEDVLYLKNESVLRGAIISKNDSSIRLQDSNGNIWAFNVTDIAKITREKRFGGYQNSSRGYAHYTELGPLVAGKTTIDGVTTAAFSFQTVNGYRFAPYFFAGAGAGVDLYATQTLLPVFGSLRGDLTKSGGIIPFYFVDAGYGINITQNAANNTDFKGGILYAAGIGVKIPFNTTAGFLISVGYRHQATSYNVNNLRTTVDYNRLAIRAGFFF